MPNMHKRFQRISTTVNNYLFLNDDANLKS